MISPRPMRTSHPSSMHWVFHQLPNLYFRTQHHKSQPPEPPQEPATRTTTRASHPIPLPGSWIWKEPFWRHCPSLAFRTRYTTMKRQADTTDMYFEEAEYFPETAWDRAWDWLLSLECWNKYNMKDTYASTWPELFNCWNGGKPRG